MRNYFESIESQLRKRGLKLGGDEDGWYVTVYLEDGSGRTAKVWASEW